MEPFPTSHVVDHLEQRMQRRLVGGAGALGALPEEQVQIVGRVVEEVAERVRGHQEAARAIGGVPKVFHPVHPAHVCVHTEHQHVAHIRIDLETPHDREA